VKQRCVRSPIDYPGTPQLETLNTYTPAVCVKFEFTRSLAIGGKRTVRNGY
jgi:hypothetical protein